MKKRCITGKRRSDRLKIVRDSGANGRLITVPTESAIMSFMNCANMWEPDAMYVMPTGMICSGWVKQSPQWNFRHIDVDLDAYIQDALDAIEYAIGDTTTKWGA